MALWLKSTDGDAPPPELLGRWIELAFWDELGRTGPRKKGANARTMSISYRYSYDNLAKINKYISDYSSDQKGCQLLELAQKWLDTDKIPQPLILHFFPGKPELRILENNLFLDTGAAVSTPPDIMNRQIVSLLYRNHQALRGENPIEVNGALAITNSLRTFCNEGIVNWISDMPNVYFTGNHPTLNKIEIASEDMFHSGRNVIGLVEKNIPEFIKSDAKLQANGQEFARSLAASHSFTKGGYAMAATIAGHLGENRLVQVKGSVSEFVAAYQEAALLNPDPLPYPGRPGVANHQTMPPFSPEVFTWLMEILAK